MSYHPRGIKMRVPADESVSHKASLMEKLVNPVAHSRNFGKAQEALPADHPIQLNRSGKDIQLMKMSAPEESTW